MTRPWSPLETEEKMVEGVARLQEAVLEFKTLGEQAAHTEWHYRHQQARCVVQAEGKNADARAAAATLLLVSMGDEHKPHPGLARDLAANAYAVQRSVIAAITSELDILRSMAASSRSRDTGQ